MYFPSEPANERFIFIYCPSDMYMYYIPNERNTGYNSQWEKYWFIYLYISHPRETTQKSPRSASEGSRMWQVCPWLGIIARSVFPVQEYPSGVCSWTGNSGAQLIPSPGIKYNNWLIYKVEIYKINSWLGIAASSPSLLRLLLPVDLPLLRAPADWRSHTYIYIYMCIYEYIICMCIYIYI